MSALYLYAVTRADRRLRLDGLHGVGPARPPVGAVQGRTMQAVVSPVAGQLRPKRRDLTAHQDVIEAVWAQGPLLPMRFGVLAPDEEAVRARLDAEQEAWAARLNELGSRAEFHVRALQSEDVALREALAADPRLAGRRGEVGRMTREQRLDYGSAVAGVLARLQQADARAIDDALRPCADGRRPGDGGGTAFYACSYLVAPERADDFRGVVDRLGQDFGERVQLRLNGPLPPYSFVEPAMSGSGAWA